MDRITLILSSILMFYLENSSSSILYQDQTLYEGSTCDLINGGKGVCTLRTDCNHYIENHREIVVCGFIKNNEIICCPKINYTGPYPTLLQACADRFRRLEEAAQDDQETERRRQEEIELRDKRRSEYFDLAIQNKEKIEETCEFEADILARSDEEKEELLSICLKTRPLWSLSSPSAVYRPVLNQHPHMTALGWKGLNGSIAWNCGGTLIHRSFVLTAAHCVHNFGKPPDIVRIGDVDLSSEDDDFIAVNYNILNIFVHEKYQAPVYYDDIALLKVEKTSEFRFKNRPLPACVWTEGELHSKQFLMMGYGAPGFGQSFLGKLYEGNLTILDAGVCASSYKTTSDLPNGIMDSQICATDPDGLLDTCEGDSGGPLQMNADDEYKTPYIVGVTSFGILCLDVCVDRDRRIDEDIRTTEETKRRREEENQKLQQYFESSRNLFVVNEKEIFDVCREESKLFGRNDEDIQLYYKKCSPYYEPSSSGLVSPSMVNPTILDEHPRMTALGWTNLDGRMAWNCGGSLIHRAFVLTAAHCMQNIGKPPDVARIGDINLSDSDSWDDKIAVDYLIEGIYVHEDYTPTYIGNLKIMLQHSFNPEGILDTCEGDSGGPLQFNANDTNRTPYDCLDGNPKVYTRVSSHLAWIEKTITENYK